MKKGKYIVINGVNKEILKEILFSKHLTEDEHSLLDDNIIQFSGKNDRLSCEDFTLYKNVREPFYKGDMVEYNFCKTQQLPYDMMVWKLLKFIKFVVLDPKDHTFEISNDNGDRYE